MKWRVLMLVWLMALGFAGRSAAKDAEVSSLKTEDLAEFAMLGAREQALIRYSLELTEKKLRYQYGSNDPANGGMDCSGTVSHILTRAGFKSPRVSHEIYLWAEKAGTLVRVKNCHSVKDPQLSQLRPGDILFWEGTYDIGKRNPPISHVMIYLGHEKGTGRAVMAGASSGRYYAGKARHGVSVFDFAMPSAKDESKFVAYARVPGLERAALAAGASAPSSAGSAPAPASVPVPSASPVSSSPKPAPSPAVASTGAEPDKPPGPAAKPAKSAPPSSRSPASGKFSVRNAVRRVLRQF